MTGTALGSRAVLSPLRTAARRQRSLCAHAERRHARRRSWCASRRAQSARGLHLSPLSHHERDLHMDRNWLDRLLFRKPQGVRKTPSRRLELELLEERCVMDVRSITGFGNNLDHLTWGAAGTNLLRVSPVAYADGISAPSTPNTLNPRQISNNLRNQSDPIFSFKDNLGDPNAQRLSDYAYAWGQFIDHDMGLSKDNSGQAFNIPASTTPGDPMGVEPFTRSAFDPATGTSTSNPRQQINFVTSYLDLSQVYGSTRPIAHPLRTHADRRPN